jgi:hypothetical protein
LTSVSKNDNIFSYDYNTIADLKILKNILVYKIKLKIFINIFNLLFAYYLFTTFVIKLVVIILVGVVIIISVF